MMELKQVSLLGWLGCVRMLVMITMKCCLRLVQAAQTMHHQQPVTGLSIC
jgi:hypothetical protein